jgi:hypothetical protein
MINKVYDCHVLIGMLNRKMDVSFHPTLNQFLDPPLGVCNPLFINKNATIVATLKRPERYAMV